MNRRLLTALALVLAPAATGAQSTTRVAVVANVQTEAALSRHGTTDFGTISGVAQAVTIDPVSPASDRSTARLTAAGTANGSITVSFDATTTLCPVSGACTNGMVFTPNISSYIGGNVQHVSTPNLASGTTLLLNANGNHFLWVGGSLQVNDGQPTGTYFGFLTVTAVFQ